MKLKVLLVDDEIHILNNLSKVLPWEAMGFEIAGLAKNGVEALETAIEHQPDLILCDIRMPIMDGMTLIQHLREQGLSSEILLLTGYQEFEYARIGIRYGVRDYICKPINYYELEEVVRKIADQIIERRKKQSKEQRLNRVASLANENYILHTLLGQEREEEGVLWDEEDGGEESKTRGVLLLDLEGYAHKSISWTLHERKAWNLHIKNLLKEMFASIIKQYTVLQVREGEWCIIFHSPQEEITKDQLRPGYEQLQGIVSEKEGMMIRMCLEQSPVGWTEMSSVYQRMQQMLILCPPLEWFLDARLFVESSASYTDSKGSQWRFIEQIGNGLRNGSHELLVQVVSELKYYVGHMTENRAAEKLLHYLLIHLLREMRELQMLSGEQEQAVWLRLQEFLSLKDLTSLVISLVDRARESLAAKKSSETLMMSAQNYIQHHLGDDFGIEDIAEYLGISCSYFCLLFKNHFGETFVEYLTKQRVEMAKCLLSGSEKSVTQIGSVVGYQERRYFTKVFQKYTGMTPSEFRLKETSIS
ncbi:two-component system response regulator YesN [Fontibacillus phaseoli]|uniref:Two-component system response regulator YesN n=1 Tax=Fontibacillus phaseoli TaxID=1416533 RepID=A0A369BR30_9BACL|nr:response regulator [Fontibacillus phaseoli]RCX23118.1 two-component system response regulator YesN [Fontibacillus phaseoli]